VNQFFLFVMLSWLLRSPVLAAAVMVAIWWFGDRATFRLLPDPFRWVMRWRRRGQLRALLDVNPHDRRARYELAELLLDGGRPAEAVAVLRPNVEAGDDDVHTAWLWGTALGRSGAFDDAEKALSVARAADPRFRAGEIDLERGRLRLARGDREGAVRALTELLELRPGTVEGRYFLVRALDGLGRTAEAEARRDEAWREFKALPRFQRSRQRAWAWRVKPWRGAMVLASVAVVVLAVLLLLAQLGGAPGPGYPSGFDPDR
jgi:tetratricopeptide (TPR) repeat protein